MHIRLLHFHKMQANQRIQFNVVCLRLFAHNLLVYLTAGGHVNNHVAENLRGT